MKKARLFGAAMAVAIVALSVNSAVRAGPLAPSGFEEDQWRYDVTPYLFLPFRLTGTSTISGITTPVDFNLSELLDVLNFAIAVRTEAWKGDFALIADINYINVGDVGAVGPVPVDVSLQQLIADFVGSYRFATFNLGPPDDAGWVQRLTLEIMGGMRVNYLLQTANIGMLSLGGDDYWVEPVVGGRIAMGLNDRVTLGLRGDVAGFGVGGDSLTWTVTAGVDWRPWETTSLKIGYRVYDINYATTLSNGPFGLNATYHGPWLGVTFRFQ